MESVVRNILVFRCHLCICYHPTTDLMILVAGLVFVQPFTGVCQCERYSAGSVWSD